MKKTKEESSSSGARKKKASKGGGKRLNDMLESMQKRSSPVNAHKVATKYFDDFKKDRKIPAKTPEKDEIATVDTGEATAVITAVDSAVISEKEKKRAKQPSKPSSLTDDPLLNRSENIVYSAMYKECLNKEADSMRFGLKELKERTGLSDKTVRVSIHSLEKKMNIRLVEPSLGIYGRKFKVLPPEDVLKERKKQGIEIDPTTKRVMV